MQKTGLSLLSTGATFSAGGFFAQPLDGPFEIIPSHYDYSLVALSYFVATIASYVALFLCSRNRADSSASLQKGLYWVSGIAMGGGIFSMHFIGMIAFHAPMTVHYDLGISLLSLLLAVGGSVFALMVTNRPDSGPGSLLIGGVAMGAAIGGMHYTGMEAMRIDATIQYLPGLFMFSLFLAVGVSLVALFLMAYFRKREKKISQGFMWVIAAIMGLAVCGMHYTGMAATVLIPSPHLLASVDEGIQHDSLALLVTSVFAIILSLAVIFSFRLELEERKRSEEKLRRLATAIDQSTQVVLITDVKGRITYANPEFEKVTGYAVAEALGKTPAMLKSGRHDISFYDSIWSTILSGGTWSGKILNKRKDGSLYEESNIISPVLNDDGVIESFVAVKNDNTAENIMRRTKDRFTAVISHELMTPLGKLQIAGILLDDLVAKGKADVETVRRAREMVTSSFNDFNLIASDATLFAQLSVPTDKKMLSPIFLYHLLDSCVAGARAMIGRENRNVTVISDLGAIAYDFKILGNHEMVALAVTKVLSNAVKYTPDGKSVHVSVTVGPDTALVTIRDEGVGISPELIGTVFEPYHSLEDHLSHSTSQYALKGGGLGLGLSITRLIMDYHGGGIAIHSEGDGKGTTIEMTFLLTAERKR